MDLGFPLPSRRRALRRAAAALLAGCAFHLGAAAAEVKVFTAGAFKPVLQAMVPGFEKRTGHKVTVTDGTPGAIAARIRQGEAFDLAVLEPALLEALAREGAVSDGSITLLAKSVPSATLYAGAVATGAVDDNAALSLLILLASEDTQAVLKDKGLAAP